MTNGVETTDYRLDEDPELLALIAAEAAEQAQLIETDFYTFNGELYSKEEIIHKGRECPYLRGMGAAAFEATINSFRVYEGADLPIPPQHPAHEAQRKPVQQPVEQAVVQIQTANEVATLVAQTEQQVRHLQTEETRATLATETVSTPETTQAVPLLAEKPGSAIVPSLKEEALTTGKTATAIAEGPAAQSQTVERDTGEISVSPPVIEAAPEVEQLPDADVAVEIEAAHNALPTFDRELLAEVNPEVAQDFESLIEHVGLEVLNEAAEAEEPIMPSSLRAAIEERQQETTPEEAVVIEALGVLIEAACERLMILEEADMLENYEAVEIEKLLTKWLEELTELGVEHAETVADLKIVIRRQLALLRIEPELSNEALMEEESTDEGTHERKHFATQLFSSGSTQNTETLAQHWWAGRIAVAGKPIFVR